ncbi:MAG TPA: hypothetical protein VLL52_24405 [Anaerolineae bacterium]|nr:hypothetical protein [Anaerolineae bacterium]
MNVFVGFLKLIRYIVDRIQNMRPGSAAILILFTVYFCVDTFVVNYDPDPNQWECLVHEEFGYAITYPKPRDLTKFGALGHKNDDYTRSIFSPNTTFVGTIQGNDMAFVAIYQRTMLKPSWGNVFLWGEFIMPDSQFLVGVPMSTTIGVDDYPAFYQTVSTNSKEKWGVLYYVMDGHNIMAIKVSHCHLPDNQHFETCNRMLDSLRLFELVD